MQRIRPLLAGLLLCGSAMLAQTGITANGTASIAVNPDQAQLTFGVITQGNTAQDASQANATQSATMQSALKSVLGNTGTIQTVGYSVYPRYSTGNNPVVVGYTASNTVQVTTNNLSIVGKLIDAASQAGANNIGGVSFGLQNPEPYRQQALTQAAKQALASAGAIAAGLGAKTGAVISAQENSSYTPTLATGVGAAAPTTTPIQTGTVNVSATVTVNVQIVQ